MNAKILKKGLWPILAVLVGLFVLLEGEARKHPSFVENQELADIARQLLVGSANSPHGIRPGVTLKHGEVVYETTELGTRGPMPLDEGFPVMVVAGDSYSWGWGLEWRWAWPERTRLRLETQMRVAELFNASIPDSSPISHTERLKFMAEELEKRGKRPTALIVGHSFHEPQMRLYRSRLALPVVLRSWLAPAPEVSIETLLAQNQKGSKRWAQSQKAYQELGRYCRAEGFKCVLVALPPTIEDFEKLSPVVSDLGEMAVRAGLFFVDPSETFEQGPWMWAQAKGETRPNAEGHNEISSRLAHELLRAGVVPKTTQTPTEIRERRIKLILEQARQAQQAQNN